MLTHRGRHVSERRPAVTPFATGDQTTAPGQKKKEPVKGDLVFVTFDDGNEAWAIKKADGGVTPMDRKKFKPPKKDKNGKDFVPGTLVSMVSCHALLLLECPAANVELSCPQNQG
jgi:hypothetical protein